MSAPQESATNDETPKAQYVAQSQDHFDTKNKNTWNQAYYVNDTFWVAGSDAPVFLCVGGEGPPLDGSAVVASVHCDVAVEWLSSKKALMFALEHRYYGCHNMAACPVHDLSAGASLKFLSSHQAVEDVAQFVRSMTKLYKLSENNKWVTWGGSYPGMLAGWSRLKHPDLIHAAVASSAPVHAKLEMTEYLDHLAFAYTVSDNGVGGSDACKAAIRKGHKWIEDNFKTTSGIAVVESRFRMPAGSLTQKEDQSNFAGMGVANFPGQENDPLCKEAACNIAKICAIMTNVSIGDEVDRLLQLRSVQSVSTSSHKQLKFQLHRQQDSLPDFWGYQTCTEFGFYQTCNVGSDCMFARGLLTLDQYTDSCMKYGIKPSDIEKNIEATNVHYGGLKPSDSKGNLGTCVLWPNGEVDPWSTLSVLESPSSKQPVLYVKGASHHAWTWPSRTADQPSVIQAREDIRNQVESFLSQDCGTVIRVLIL
jgi:hypothetical protein